MIEQMAQNFPTIYVKLFGCLHSRFGLRGGFSPQVNHAGKETDQHDDRAGSEGEVNVDVDGEPGPQRTDRVPQARSAR